MRMDGLRMYWGEFVSWALEVVGPEWALGSPHSFTEKNKKRRRVKKNLNKTISLLGCRCSISKER
jgi:hypothetical protein